MNSSALKINNSALMKINNSMLLNYRLAQLCCWEMDLISNAKRLFRIRTAICKCTDNRLCHRTSSGLVCCEVEYRCGTSRMWSSSAVSCCPTIISNTVVLHNISYFMQSISYILNFYLHNFNIVGHHLFR